MAVYYESYFVWPALGDVCDSLITHDSTHDCICTWFFF
jgi:hypothetical protein